MNKFLALTAVLTLCTLSAHSAERNAAATSGPFVSLCTGIHLSAAYLAPTTPGGPIDFLFTLQNETARAIKLAQPVPSSAHWYARSGQKWLWRASAGGDGSLADGLREQGRLLAHRPQSADAHPVYLTVPAHSSRQWTASERDNPALAYKPGCAICNYPGEREYRVIFAYAYLPAPNEQSKELLTCGLRSSPVIMPPFK